MQTDPHEKQHTIIVNMRPKKWSADSISFEQVVALAYPDDPPSPTRIYSVGWKHGNEDGSLVAGQSVPVKSGMVFSVTFTDRS